jgi:rSAM/selenodomain-associated transferase 1
MNYAVIIMTKVPIAGTVKTRLQPLLSPKECAELAVAFLRDTVNKARVVCNKTIVAFSPFDKQSELEKILKSEYFYVAQKGVNLGEKIFNAFRFAFENNSDSVVMIGTDSPTFPADFIESAFDNLKSADAVLGKTADGGFYLIGLRRLQKEIFENVEWSTAKTFEQIKQNITHLNYKLQEIPSWYDIDEPEDLKRLYAEFLTDKQAKKIAPLTYEWLMKQKIFSKPSD